MTRPRPGPQSLFRRLVWRALAREPGRALLAVLSVALGVSVFLAIRLANRSAVASFEAFAQGIGTGADLSVRAAVGPLDEALLPRLDGLRRDFWIRPVLEGSFTRGAGLEPFQVLATDLVGLGGSAGERADPDPAPAAWAGFGQALRDPDAVLVSRDLALSAGLGPGDFQHHRPSKSRQAQRG